LISKGFEGGRGEGGTEDGGEDNITKLFVIDHGTCHVDTENLAKINRKLMHASMILDLK